MKAYWIAHVDVTDPDQYSQYTRRAPQAFAVFVGQGQADQATGFTGHETDRLGCAAVGGQQQVAFVFPVFIVDQQDHFAEAVIFDDFFDAVEGHVGILSV